MKAVPPPLFFPNGSYLGVRVGGVYPRRDTPRIDGGHLGEQPPGGVEPVDGHAVLWAQPQPQESPGRGHNLRVVLLDGPGFPLGEGKLGAGLARGHVDRRAGPLRAHDDSVWLGAHRIPQQLRQRRTGLLQKTYAERAIAVRPLFANAVNPPESPEA